MLYIDFTPTAASNIESDDVTNEVTHRIYNTNLYYSAHFVIKLTKKVIFSGGF